MAGDRSKIDLEKKIEGLQNDLIASGASAVADDTFKEIQAKITDLETELTELNWGAAVGEGEISTARRRL